MFYCTWRTVRGVLCVAYNVGDIMYGTRCVVHSYSVRTLYIVHYTQAYTYNPNYEWIEMNLVKKKTINSLTQWHSVKDKQRSLAILVHPVHSSLSLSLSLHLSPHIPHNVHSYHLSLHLSPPISTVYIHIISLYTSFPISPTLSCYITTIPLSLTMSHYITAYSRILSPSLPLSRHLTYHDTL